MPLLADFSVPSEAGNERVVSERVRQAVAGLPLDERQMERLRTAVAEATLNAIEHGNGFRAELPVLVRVESTASEVRVSITDRGCGPVHAYEEPELEKKLAGQQSPRGWGLFLMEKMVDAVSDETQHAGHTLRLSVRFKPGQVAR